MKSKPYVVGSGQLSETHCVGMYIFLGCNYYVAFSVGSAACADLTEG